VEIIGHCAVLAADKGGPVVPIVDQWIIEKLAGETDDGRPGAPFGPPSCTSALNTDIEHQHEQHAHEDRRDTNVYAQSG
jgi:hypothetical protein